MIRRDFLKYLAALGLPAPLPATIGGALEIVDYELADGWQEFLSTSAGKVSEVTTAFNEKLLWENIRLVDSNGRSWHTENCGNNWLTENEL